MDARKDEKDISGTLLGFREKMKTVRKIATLNVCFSVYSDINLNVKIHQKIQM